MPLILLLIAAQLAWMAGCAALDTSSRERPDWVVAHDEDCLAAPRRAAGCARLSVSVPFAGGRPVMRLNAHLEGGR